MSRIRDSYVRAGEGGQIARFEVYCYLQQWGFKTKVTWKVVGAYCSE